MKSDFLERGGEPSCVRDFPASLISESLSFAAAQRMQRRSAYFGLVKVRNEVDTFFIEVWPQKRRFFFGMSTKGGWGKIPPKKINVQTDVTWRGIRVSGCQASNPSPLSPNRPSKVGKSRQRSEGFLPPLMQLGSPLSKSENSCNPHRMPFPLWGGDDYSGRMRKGVAISPGVVVARAYRIDEALALRARAPSDTIQVATELARFDQACDIVANDLDQIIDRVAREVDADSAAIFHAHRLLVRDPALISKVKGFILNRQVDASQALQLAMQEYSELFSRFQDEYLRERMADIRDVVGRIVGHLTMAETNRQLSDSEPVILVAPEILPSQAVTFEKLPVAGIVTESGGSTGHAAILARSMGIPAVSGLRGILREVHTGDLLIVDGREGIVIISPGHEVESAYRKMQREYVDLRDALVENREQESITLDGIRVELLANVNNVLDAAAAEGVGGSGVGLFRSEFVFLTHPSIPSEEDQLAAYRAVIEAAPNNRVTIRTLDLGGDKQVPYLGSQKETNPFMGWRSIRMTTAYPEFFQTQLRAILRAGSLGNVSILFPMVTTLEEVIQLREFFEETRRSLRASKIPFQENIPFGVMIEVPAAAFCIDHLLDAVDFISIGSNDLIQYVMAADRDNPKVAHLCEPFHPALFRVLRTVISESVLRNKPVTLCGEMAARPTCLLPLLGMGLRHFSMSPAFIPTVKEMVRSIRLQDGIDAAETIFQMKTAVEIRHFLFERVRQLCPQVAQMETI